MNLRVLTEGTLSRQLAPQRDTSCGRPSATISNGAARCRVAQCFNGNPKGLKDGSPPGRSFFAVSIEHTRHHAESKTGVRGRRPATHLDADLDRL
jgi:hypothetical protein